MTSTLKFGTVALAAAVLAPTASAINLLANPGFETGNISPWFNGREFGTNGSGQLWHAVNTDSHTGSWSAMVESNKEMRQNFTPTLVSDITEASVWIKVPEVGGIFGVWHYYSDATEGFEVFSPANTGWNKYDITADLQSGKTLIGFGVNGYIGGGSDPDLVFADDGMVNSTAIPEPATLTVLTLGALALVRRRRKT
jgi:hypothetical protein